MDPDRLQAYLNLVKKLLACPSGEEPHVLQEHTDLVDGDFLQLLPSVAEQLRQEGQDGPAQFINDLARGLAQALEMTVTSAAQRRSVMYAAETQHQFIRQLLQTLSDKRGRDSTKAVSALLDARQEYLNDTIPSAIRRVWTELRKDFPEEQHARLAVLVLTLGVILQEHPRGSPAANQEGALAAYHAASEVLTRGSYPVYWAMTQNNLGNALHERIRGDRAENLDDAIDAFRNAAEVYALKTKPVQWASTQNNLGAVLRKRIRGDRAENLDDAIDAFRKALEVRTRDASPLDWAMTQNNLGNALYDRALLRKRIRGDRAENLDDAIDAFRKALEVRTRDASPLDWAMTQNNLGNALCERTQGDHAENLDAAIASYRNAAGVYTRETRPVEWAVAHNNLGRALYDRALLRKRIRDDRAENLDDAIDAFLAAFEVFNPEGFPHLSLNAGRNLGRTGLEAERWTDAVFGFRNAVEGAEQHRRQADDERRRDEILADAHDAYAGLVEAYLRTGQPAKALETAERSKARSLVELLAGRDLRPQGYVDPEILDALDRLRREQTALQRQVQSGARTSPNVYTADGQNGNVTNGHASGTSDEGDASRTERGGPVAANRMDFLERSLLATREELEQVVERIGEADPAFTLAQDEVRPLPASAIRALLPDEQTALLSFYLAPSALFAFVQTRDAEEPAVVELGEDAVGRLFELLDDYLRSYYSDRRAWAPTLPSRLTALAEVLSLDRLLAAVPTACDRLVILPHRLLHLLPLHALPLPDKPQRCLLDRFERGIGMAPSAHLLQLALGQDRPGFETLLAVQNPTEDLLFTDIEVPSVAALFDEPTILAHEAARTEAIQGFGQLQNTHCLHFSCHGAFDLVAPLESSLHLAADERLSLAEVFGLDLRRCRLVTLSACETGVVEFQRSSEEYVGLPSGFLFAGSPTVVSSLWAVDDLSAALLVVRFYETLHERSDAGRAFAVSESLSEAQRWLRRVTVAELRTRIASWTETLGLDTVRKKDLRRFLSTHADADRPFAAPYHWAAFVAVGG